MEYFLTRTILETIAPTSAAAANGILFGDVAVGPGNRGGVLITAISADVYVKFVNRGSAAPTLTTTDFHTIVRFSGDCSRDFQVAESVDVYTYSTGNVAGVVYQ